METPKPTAGAAEFSAETMTNVFAKLGQKAPAAITEAGEKPAGETETTTEETQKPEGQEADGGEGNAAENQTSKDEGEETQKPEGQEADGGEGEAAAEANPEAKALSEETGKLLRQKLKDLPEETRSTVQSFMDERIAKITGKAKSENDRLGTRVTELTGELEAVRKNGPVPVVIAGIHPALLADTVEQIDTELQKIESFEDWADANRDGYTGDETKGEPSYTAEQIRAQLRLVQREKDRILPAARAKLADRAKADEGLRAAMPALFDAKTAEYAQAQTILKAQPHLRARADQNVIIAQMILGQRALQALQKPAGHKPGNSAPNAEKNTATGAKPPLRKAPRAPGDGAPALGSPLDRPNQRPAPDAAVKQFTQTRSRSDLKRAVGALVFG